MRKLLLLAALFTAGLLLATGTTPAEAVRTCATVTRTVVSTVISTVTVTVTNPGTTTAPTTITTPPPPNAWPAQWRFAYSNRADQALMPSYGYNLIDVSTVSEALAVPAGTQAQVWLYDYDNATCTWEKDDAYVIDIVSQLASSDKVAGFYFSNEPHPWDCPSAPAQHKARSDLIHSLAPSKYTLIGLDSNDRPHFDAYGSEWVGTADYVNYNPYICYERDTSTCDFAWLDHVLAVAQSLPQPYFVALQAFREAGEWRWPTASEESQMLERLKDPALTGLHGYLTFSWNWQNDPLTAHPEVLNEIQAYNRGRPSPCCSGGGGSTTSTTTPTTTTTPPPPSTDPVLVGAGDSCGSAASCTPTADLIQTLNPTAVFTVGDNAYEDGTLTEYNAYYDPNWGRFKSITHPATGNHDYHTTGAAGYFSYYGAQAPAPYYSYDLGTWHIIVLASDSGITPSSGSAEETWLRQDLAAYPNACTLAYWHEPRWSSGSVHGNSSTWDTVWTDLYNAHVDVVLNGHDHTYQRYGLLNPAGQSDPNGIQEFVAGTGGWGHYDFTTTSPMPTIRDNTSYGVLKLTLHSASYDFEFVPITGASFHDQGSGTCR